MREGEFKLTMHRGWEAEVFKGPDMQQAVAEYTTHIMKLAIAKVPRGNPKKPHFNEIRKNIGMTVNRDLQGWWGNVTIESNPKVRHALLQEYGWTDRAGGKHLGRKFLKEALLRARIE
ncbi:hypothetical protein AB0D68_10885 [Streptomyces sp. NPDC048212]|uniref:hypothetical protein n=1 Tax=Streptomyces sp. NPDC048212 TaxID=3156658 RepID=UPI0033C1B867